VAAARPSEIRPWEELARAEMKADMRRIQQTDGPIVVGPWMSEVGFEILYWIPFLRWAITRFELDPARLVVVSRGGVSSWYEGLCGRYLDVFDSLSVDDFRELTQRRWADAGGQKQMSRGPWDDEVLTALGAAAEHEPDANLHPSVMYRLFRRNWRSNASIRHVLAHTRYARFGSAAADLPPGLPDEYLAVKFYFRTSFVDSGAIHTFIRNSLAALSAARPVVLLNTDLEMDDHVDADPGRVMNVLRPLAGTPPARNLAAQTAVIERASALVGTYGGLSYLAPSVGVPSLSFYTAQEHFLPFHLDVARRAAQELGTSFSSIDIRHAQGLAAFHPRRAA
jgi:hypothetical protein